ncbi:hypothetical protein ABPG75_009143 [Micractinium tetrahymenae]
MSIDVSHFQVGPGPPPPAFCPPFGGQAFPGAPPAPPRGDSSISSGSWGADTDCGSTGSPLSLAGFQGALDRACSAPVHLQAMRMASLTLEDASFLEKAASIGGPPCLSSPQPSAVGWGGAPIQPQGPAPQQQAGGRFRHEDFAGGLGRGGRGPVPGPSGGRGPQQHGGPQQHHARHHQGGGRPHGDSRQKNHGYRRLWQQVTQVGRGGKLGDHEGGVAFSEMTVEDLLEVVRRLPPEASAVKAIGQALYYFDSGALAALLKELNKSGHVRRAQEIFDWLRSLDDSHDLYALCNTMTYTTMISQCGSQQQLRRALELVAEMRSRGVQCNVHTYSALMNVCIKGNELDLALDVYRQMLAEGCTPNLVTWNTLIDVYGKTGAWEEAIRVLDALEQQGIDPEIRTYNTVIIACNMSGQAQEALRIYERMLAAGAQPTATTYTALISAYGKNGQLDKALQIFQDMVRRGCERNVITYSSLISACEKAGRWELALELFREMHAEGCRPNVVTFNSLIAACAQGAQWEKAQELFEQMQHRGCKPDSVTFGGLIAAYDRAGHWRRALTAFEQMKVHNCRPDSVVYNTVVGALWRTGLVWAQAKAMQIFHAACRQGHFRITVHTLDATAAAAAASGGSTAVGSPTAAAAAALAATGSAAGSGSGSGSGSRAGSPTLSMPQAISGATPDLCSPACSTPVLPGTPLSALAMAMAAGSPSPSASPLCDSSLAAAAAASLAAAAAAPGALAASAGNGAGTVIEFGMHAFTVGSAVLSLLRWVAELRERLPREPNKDLRQQVCLVLNKGKPSREHTYPAIRAALCSLLRAWASPFALTDIPQGCRIQATACDITGWLHSPEADRALAAFNARADGGRALLAKEVFFQQDAAAEARCAEAFAAVRHFESCSCVPDSALPASYLGAREGWFATCASFAAVFGLKDEVLHDAVLLLDRAVAAAGDQLLTLNAAALVVSCLLISARQAGESPERLPSPAQLESATGLTAAAVDAAQGAVRAMLQGDTSAISAVRVLKLLLERLGADFSHHSSLAATAGPALALVNAVAGQPGLREMRPSALAAALLLASRKAAGISPFWPSALAVLTGSPDEPASELGRACDQVSAALVAAGHPNFAAV